MESEKMKEEKIIGELFDEKYIKLLGLEKRMPGRLGVLFLLGERRRKKFFLFF